MAIKELNSTCSSCSSCCEGNWNVNYQLTSFYRISCKNVKLTIFFTKYIYSKERCRHSNQKLQDLVYIKYSQAIKESIDNHDLTDAMVLNDVDEKNEWLSGEMANGDEETVQEDKLMFKI